MGNNEAQILMSVIVAVPAFLIALTYHEIAHAFVADRLGDPTARMLGRLSLNPIKHLDPLYTLIMPIAMHIMFGFAMGGAKPVPVNPLNLKHPKQDLAWISFAGPLTNVILAVGSAIGLRLMAPLAHPWGVPGIAHVYAGGGFDPHGIEYVLLPIALVLYYSVWVNVILALFNMLPIPPLDGSKVLAGVLPDRISDVIDGVGMNGMFLLIAVLVLADRTGIWSEYVVPVFQKVLVLLLY